MADACRVRSPPHIPAIVGSRSRSPPSGNFAVSDQFYDLLREFQSTTLGNVEHDYPSTERVEFEDGTAHTLQVRKKVASAATEIWEPASSISGVGWQRHYVVWGDEGAGYSALLDPAPFQVIDHGESHYENDAYGIHLFSEDRLTFLGKPGEDIYVRLLDCRRGSPTLGRQDELRFKPTPLKFLVIPPGVAHGFRNLEGVFTVNRPRRCAGNLEDMTPGNDVIDWHFDQLPAPSFEIDNIEAPLEYYKELAQRQRKFIDKEVRDSTPMVFLATDAFGKQVRVALRRQGNDKGHTPL